MRNSGMAHDWPIGIKYEAPPHYLVPTYSVLPLTIALKSSLSRVRTRPVARISLPRRFHRPPLWSTMVTCSRSCIIPVHHSTRGGRTSSMCTPRPQSSPPPSPPSRRLEDTQLNDSESPTISEAKYGFKIYRTDYSDETKWHRFMTYLNAQTQARMEEENLVHEIPNIDWAVESSPELARASEEEIRRYVARLIQLAILRYTDPTI
jgi:hypothetical protein